MTVDQISPLVCFPLTAGPATSEFISTIIFTGRPKKEIIRHAMSCGQRFQGFNCLVPVFEAGLWGLSLLDARLTPFSLNYKSFYVHLDHTKPLMRDL